jgi:hypothetical protein
MTTGTGPQALADYIESNWQETRAGRTDVPPITPDHKSQRGSVFIQHDRDDVAWNTNVHAGQIHCYHPDAANVEISDEGYASAQEIETVQVDIAVTDGTAADGTRRDAKAVLTGDRSDAGFPSGAGPPYPGVNGEFKYVMETARRNFEEWDVSRFSQLTMYKGGARASASWNVELEHIARNTV